MSCRSASPAARAAPPSVGLSARRRAARTDTAPSLTRPQSCPILPQSQTGSPLDADTLLARTAPRWAARRTRAAEHEQRLDACPDLGWRCPPQKQDPATASSADTAALHLRGRKTTTASRPQRAPSRSWSQRHRHAARSQGPPAPQTGSATTHDTDCRERFAAAGRRAQRSSAPSARLPAPDSAVAGSSQTSTRPSPDCPGPSPRLLAGSARGEPTRPTRSLGGESPPWHWRPCCGCGRGSRGWESWRQPGWSESLACGPAQSAPETPPPTAFARRLALLSAHHHLLQQVAAAPLSGLRLLRAASPAWQPATDTRCRLHPVQAPLQCVRARPQSRPAHPQTSQAHAAQLLCDSRGAP
eukprot:m.55302 g.55302  ORF g.55302 m.55302 type:complete len:357 (+) comp6916_c0_seq3:287-1357(+)